MTVIRSADLIAVTGATGFVGQALMDAAATVGIELRALTRRRQEPRAGVEWVEGDLGDARALRRLMNRASAVIHVAGVVNSPDPEGFEIGNVTGTLNVVNAALDSGAGRFIHVSSLPAREPDLSIYGASKRKGERIVAASSLDWTIVRPPAVYGPRDTEMFELFRLPRRLLEWVARADRAVRKDRAKLTLDRVGYMCHPDWTAGSGKAPPPERWTPQVETGLGLHATAAWYRDMGWL